MHAAAAKWVARHAPDHPVSWLDVGGRDINGGVSDLFEAGSRRCGIDLEHGPAVDIVADVRTFHPWPYDVVCCLEVLEHAEDAKGVVEACWRNVKPGGMLILTAAGPGRAPHSGHDGGPLHPGEHYANIDPDDLERWIDQLTDMATCTVDTLGEDVRAVAVRRV